MEGSSSRCCLGCGFGVYPSFFSQLHGCLHRYDCRHRYVCRHGGACSTDVRTFEVLRKPWGVWATKPTLRGPFSSSVSLQDNLSAPENKKGDSCYVPHSKKQCRGGDSANEGGDGKNTEGNSLCDVSKNGGPVSARGEQPKQCLGQHSLSEGDSCQRGCAISPQPRACSRDRSDRKGQSSNCPSGNAARSGTEKADTATRNTSSRTEDTSSLATFPVLLSHLLRQPLPQEYNSRVSLWPRKITDTTGVQRTRENRGCSTTSDEDSGRTRARQQRDKEEAGEAPPFPPAELPNGKKRVRSGSGKESNQQDEALRHHLTESFLDFEATHYPLPMRGHTGYLTVAIKPRVFA